MMLKIYFRKIFVYSILITSQIFIITCSQPSEPKPEKGRISLTAETVAASFVRLKLEISSEQKYNRFEVYSTDSLIINSYITDRDTVFFHFNLNPGTSYHYKAKLFMNQNEIDTSKILSLKTSLVTSHEFIWNIDTLGDNESTLRDVSIITENTVWAVGELKRNQDYYNALKWNGTNWEFIKVPLRIWQTDDYIASRLNAFIAIDTNDVWFTNKGEVVHYNGIDWDYRKFLFSNLEDSTFGGIQSFWAYDSINIWAIGSKGNLFFYNGLDWKQLNNFSNDDFIDITGYVNYSKNSMYLWVCGQNILYYSKDGAYWQKVWDKENPFLPDNFLNPTAIEIIDNCLVVAVYNYFVTRIYLLNPEKPNAYILLTEFEAYVQDISGNSLDDIFFVGAENKIYHYNGESTYFYSNLSTLGKGQLLSVSFKKDNVFCVGYSGGSSSKAWVIRGYR